ncbi:MAG: O-antigen ligase family protein [Clostridia bacterium]
MIVSQSYIDIFSKFGIETVNIIFILTTILNIALILSKTNPIKIFKIFIGLVSIYMNLVILLDINSSYIYIYILNIYIAFKNILDSLEESFKFKDSLLINIMWILGPYYLFKEKFILREQLEDSLKLKTIIVFYSFLILLNIFYKNKETFKNRDFKRGLFRVFEIIQVTFPFYLLKDGGLKTYPLIILVACGTILKNKKIEGIKEYKYIYSFIILWGSITGLSLLGVNPISQVSKEYLLKTIGLIGYLILLLQLEWKEEIRKKAMCIFIFSSFLTVMAVIIQFTKNNFLFIRYTDGYLIIPFGIKSSIIAIIILYIILMYKKIELLPFFILGLFGVVLSGSRGPFGALLVCLFLMIALLYRKQWKKFCISIMVVVLILGILLKITPSISNRIKLMTEGKDGSTKTRIYIYKESLRQFLKKPLLGNGIGRYQEVSLVDNKNKGDVSSDEWVGLYHHTYSHNNILGLLSGVGILGFLSYYLFQLSLLFNFKNKKDFILGAILILSFELNGITDMSLIFFRIQEILFFVYVLILKENKEEFIKKRP